MMYLGSWTYYMAKNSKKLQELFVSVVLLTDESSLYLRDEIIAICKILKNKYTNYELIIIDNQIPDQILETVLVLLRTTPCIRIIRLSKIETKDVCVYAGIESAIGDITIIMTVNQDPIDLIPNFVKQAQKSDIVFGVSNNRTRRGLFNHYGARLFYWYNKKFLNISIPTNSTYYIALNRKAVNALTRTERHARHIRYLARQIGYKSEEYHYTPVLNSSKRKGFFELSASAIELASNYSKHPLRILSWIGVLAALANLLYAGYVVIINVIKKHVAEGWTTTSLQSSIMFFLLFVILAILAEYIGKILEETRNEPHYHIIEEINSKVSVADATRRNIIK